MCTSQSILRYISSLPTQFACGRDHSNVDSLIQLKFNIFNFFSLLWTLHELFSKVNHSQSIILIAFKKFHIKITLFAIQYEQDIYCRTFAIQIFRVNVQIVVLNMSDSDTPSTYFESFWFIWLYHNGIYVKNINYTRS